MSKLTILSEAQIGATDAESIQVVFVELTASRRLSSSSGHDKDQQSPLVTSRRSPRP